MTAARRTRLRHRPDHRILDQIAFLVDFPAYSASSLGDRTVIWYRDGERAASLLLTPNPATEEVLVDGDLDRAARVFRIGSPPLPPVPPDGARRSPHGLLFERYAGIRPILFADPWEGLCWTILGQQVHVDFAVHLKRVLSARYGPKGLANAETTAVFPSPSRIASLSVDELRALKLSRQKASTLLEIARRVDGGSWDLEAMEALPASDLISTLQSVKGIGPWTASYSLARVFGHPDAFPAEDVGLRRAWTRMAGLAKMATAADLAAEASVWEGWRSDFAFWLWLSNREKGRAKARRAPSGPGEA